MEGHADAFRAYHIEEGESGEPKGRMTRIGLSKLNEGELLVRVSHSNLNYKDALAATGFGLSEDRDGGYAEYARLKAEHALKIPGGLDAERAMAMGTAGLTAALSVTRMEHNGLSPEKGPVAVTGATGGVGSLAIDMLSDLGYEVVAITGKGTSANISRASARTRPSSGKSWRWAEGRSRSS